MGLLACCWVEDGLAFQEGSQESCPPRFHQPLPPQTFTPRDSRGHGSAEVEPLPSSCVLLSPPVFLISRLISSALTLGGHARGHRPLPVFPSASLDVLDLAGHGSGRPGAQLQGCPSHGVEGAGQGPAAPGQHARVSPSRDHRAAGFVLPS